MIPMVEEDVFGVGSTITLGDGSTRLIEDINIGDEIKTCIWCTT